MIHRVVHSHKGVYRTWCGRRLTGKKYLTFQGKFIWHLGNLKGCKQCADPRKALRDSLNWLNLKTKDIDDTLAKINESLAKNPG